MLTAVDEHGVWENMRTDELQQPGLTRGENNKRLKQKSVKFSFKEHFLLKTDNKL